MQRLLGICTTCKQDGRLMFLRLVFALLSNIFFLNILYFNMTYLYHHFCNINNNIYFNSFLISLNFMVLMFVFLLLALDYYL